MLSPTATPAPSFILQSEVLVSFKIKKGGRISPAADNDILFSLFYREIELFPGIFQTSQIMEICIAHSF